MKRLLRVVAFVCLIFCLDKTTWATDYPATSGKLSGGATVDGNYVKISASGGAVSFTGLPSAASTVNVYFYTTSNANANLNFNGKYNATIRNSTSLTSVSDPKGSYAKTSYYLKLNTINNGGTIWIHKISIDNGDSTAPEVSLTAPAADTIVRGKITLTATATDADGISKVAFYCGSNLIDSDTTSPYEASWDTSALTDGSYSLTAQASDKSGNTSVSKTVKVTVNNSSSDKIPPTISLTAPSAGATLTGNTTISATASDNIGVTKVVFYYGANQIGSDTSSPYSVSWDTTGVANASYRLKAVAYDAAGNTGTSGSVEVKINNDITTTSDFRDETVYFVMTDRFVDGDSSNNSLYSDEFRSPDNSNGDTLRYYNGGDFKGLINNLDYIAGMGFTALWITPVVKQPPGRLVTSNGGYDGAGYHGYWGYDFDSIDPHLESNGYTFDDLIAKAHSKGIKIVLDIVPNHGHGTDAGTTTRWYADRNKVKFNGTWRTYDKSSDPYLLNSSGISDIWDKTPGFFNYNSSYKLLDLIDFNECDPRTRADEIAVYKKFIDKGVDGFRIDTVAYMRPAFWNIFTNEIWSYANSLGKPWFWQVGEAWVSDRSTAMSFTNSHFTILDLFGSCMDYMGQAKSVFAGSNGFEKMSSIMSSDSASAIDPTFTGTFVDNHDKPRFPGGTADTSTMANEWKNALNWYWLARGIPILYYGSEFEATSDSLNDNGSGDPINRKYVGQSLINKARSNPNSYPIYQHIKVLNALRKNFEVLRKGSQTNISLNGNLAKFKRVYSGSVAYIALNKANSSQSVTFNSLPNMTYQVLSPNDASGAYSTTSASVTDNSYTTTVPENSLVVLIGVTPASAERVAINGSYTATMTLTSKNQWEATLDFASLGNTAANLYFDVTVNGTTTRYGDDDEISPVVPLSDTATTSTTNPITLAAEAGPSGSYKIVFNDAFKTYSITYQGSEKLPTVLEIFSSAVTSSEWIGVCGSYSPVTKYSDTANHAGDLPWWASETAAAATYYGIKDGQYVWIWKSNQITPGAKFEWKPRRNGSTWNSGSNIVGYGGAISTVTAW